MDPARFAGVVLGIEARGMLLGPLAALSLGVGFATVHKGTQPDDAEGQLVTRTTPPDYKHRASSLSSDAVFVCAKIE
jgi:adenine phosphoribosyltransferase